MRKPVQLTKTPVLATLVTAFESVALKRRTYSPMALKEREVAKHGECRKCSAYCDKLVEPRGCLEMRCSYLYSYEDELTGNRYLGCLNRVFGCEIDVDAYSDWLATTWRRLAGA